MNYNGSEKYSALYATRNPKGPKQNLMVYVAVFRVIQNNSSFVNNSFTKLVNNLLGFIGLKILLKYGYLVCLINT